MPLHLTPTEHATLSGHDGEAARLALRIVVRMAEVLDAPCLQPVSQAHIDACGLLSDASLEFAETLASKNARVAIPTTLSMGPLDLQRWRQFGIPEDYAERATRQGQAYENMGCLPTWTCAPYQGYLTPRFGQHLAWGESNAVCYANSVLGARTNRTADYLDICEAITGRTPSCGMHLDQNRRGQVLVRLVDLDPGTWNDTTSWAVLGHLLGPLVREKIPVLEGLPVDASSDQLKALCAAAASSGGVALFHAVGLTPEAPTLEAACGGVAPEQIHELRAPDLAAGRADLSTAADDERLEAVVLGCPHFSYDEFRELANLLEAAPAGQFAPHVRFITVTSRASDALMRGSPILEVLERWGVLVTLDTCVFHTPMLTSSAKRLMTNSGKCAYYAPGELDAEIAFGTLAECVASAIAGKILREARS